MQAPSPLIYGGLAAIMGTRFTQVPQADNFAPLIPPLSLIR